MMFKGAPVPSLKRNACTPHPSISCVPDCHMLPQFKLEPDNCSLQNWFPPHVSYMSILSRPNSACVPWSSVTDAVKFAKISDMVVPIGVPDGPRVCARSTIPAPPVSESPTNCRIADPPPRLSAKNSINMNPAP